MVEDIFAFKANKSQTYLEADQKLLHVLKKMPIISILLQVILRNKSLEAFNTQKSIAYQ
jgi:hypothetical protein